PPAAAVAAPQPPLVGQWLVEGGATDPDALGQPSHGEGLGTLLLQQEPTGRNHLPPPCRPCGQARGGAPAALAGAGCSARAFRAWFIRWNDSSVGLAIMATSSGASRPRDSPRWGGRTRPGPRGSGVEGG